MTDEIVVIPTICTRHCGVCEGMDHHWMPWCDDDDPEPRMICKHCDAVREYTDEDGDF